MENKDKIRIKAMCLLIDKSQRVLLGKDYDRVKNENFYRVLGGSLNSGENAGDGVRREIREELNCEIENLEALEIINNEFVYNGKRGHEIVHLFQGNVSNRELETQNMIHIIEDGYEFDAEWVPVENIVGRKVILYPAFEYEKFLWAQK